MLRKHDPEFKRLATRLALSRHCPRCRRYGQAAVRCALCAVRCALCAVRCALCDKVLWNSSRVSTLARRARYYVALKIAGWVQLPLDNCLKGAIRARTSQPASTSGVPAQVLKNGHLLIVSRAKRPGDIGEPRVERFVFEI